MEHPQTIFIKINVKTKGALKIGKVDKESGKVIPNTIFHLGFGTTMDAKIQAGETISVTFEIIWKKDTALPIL
ncbi:hypothetical protein E0T48_001115 [Enterococcus faecalis]|nr:hypothetical protein [Enterococcus faecalis]EGO9216600.1 hypothetical protein [Enterococcus faecalis]EHK9980877.1 hypothetical protein [Enterococcus faecalis]EKE3415500.1 hypothetical protein [Enterococcus faecalis]EKJ5025766.1 hypothetical protein [Enterococcus faecalis]